MPNPIPAAARSWIMVGQSYPWIRTRHPRIPARTVMGIASFNRVLHFGSLRIRPVVQIHVDDGDEHGHGFAFLVSASTRSRYSLRKLSLLIPGNACTVSPL
jgi:hypothetical protein